MPASGSPAVRRRRLAAELRRLRTTADKTAEDVEAVLGWSRTKVSRFELAQGGLKPADVEKLLEFYGVQRSQREQLLALAEEGTHKGWWEAYDDVLTEGYLEYIGLEATTTSILEWQINVVPGLLQAEQYAWEVLSGYQEAVTISPRAIERRVETRLIRQQLLTRDKPLKYAALLDEPVVHQQRGDRSVMHAQLQGLADIAELPNVTIRIVSLKGNRGLTVNSFSIIQFGKAHETMLHDVSRPGTPQRRIARRGWDRHSPVRGSLPTILPRNAAPSRKPRAHIKTKFLRNQAEGLSMGDIAPARRNGDKCDPSGRWRKSSYSMSNGQCVEIARLAGGRIGVRDSKVAEGLVLRFEPETWAAFLAELRTSGDR
jgi:transcriptional regulator with XRE-family HTH domain